MKKRGPRFAFLIVLVSHVGISCEPKIPARPDDAVKAVPLAQVEITDTFWAPKQDVNRTASIPHVFSRSEERGRGGPAQLFEAAGYILAKAKDPAFEAYIEDKVEALLARQAAASPSPRRAGGTSAEAAAAYFEGTGDRRLLDNALKEADAAVEAIGPGKKAYISGHEGQKIGLIRLFRLTGEEKYWRLAKFLLDIRGRAEFQEQTASEYPGEREYNQNHKPVVEQTEAVGHAVRAMYLYIPLTDIAALTGQPEYGAAADAIWEDIVGRKMYITGGVGSIRQQEKFGPPYLLPNVSAWHETCASYGMAVWNHRLFLLHREAKYVDTMERILYNGFAAGVSLEGDRFFYQNVLTSYGNYGRFDWINVPCCPPNVIRLMAQLGGYIYAQTDEGIYVNLFVDSKARVAIGGSTVTLTQATRYPWDGKIRLTVEPGDAGRFSIRVRIPGWSLGTPVPSDLYSYLDATGESPSLLLNGKAAAMKIEKGFAVLSRRWKPGDTIDLDLPMPVRRAVAHPSVADDAGLVALERGPIVYCAEWPDNGGRALNIIVPDGAALRGEYRSDLLRGVGVIRGEVRAAARGADGATVETVAHDLLAIPYYAWANRGKGEMTVWLAREAKEAYLEPVLRGPLAGVSAFGGIEKSDTGYGDQNDELDAVYDGYEPLRSFDESRLYYRVRPPKGMPAWIEYDFKAPTGISSSKVYFADDERFCRLPASWRILIKDGNAWRPVETDGGTAVKKDAWSEATFKPVRTTAVRLEIEPRTVLYKGGAAGPPAAMPIDKDVQWREAGVIEWRVK